MLSSAIFQKTSPRCLGWNTGRSGFSEPGCHTANVVTNPSSEDTTTIADENARLKTLLETGMHKSLKGHYALCDVLKKQILNRNPRKEGFGFERKNEC